MQVKESLDNPEMVAFVKNVVMEGFKEWSKNHSGEAKRIGDYVKSMAKIRLNALKEKKHVVKENFANGFSGEKPKNWSGKCRLYGKVDENGEPYKIEIYIVEGESAGGSAKQARNRLYQEIYKLKGVPLNTVPRANTLEAISKALDDLLNNDEFKGLRIVLNCGMNKKIDITNCPYDKIIIDSDGDIDGGRITSLVCAYFYFHCRELIEAGKLYKILAPLYKIESGKGKNKKDIFFNDNTEYLEYIQQEISDKLFIEGKIDDNWSDIEKDDIISLMSESSEYRRKMNKLSKHSVIDIVLLEKFISNFKYIRSGDLKTFEKEILKISKDLKVQYKSDDTIIIRGLYNREMQLFRITNKLLTKTKSIEDYYNNLEFKKFKVNGNKISLIELLELIFTYEPDHIQRFKGLGEMDASELGKTTMIPGQRKLIRLTTSDVEKEINQFLVLHSEGVKYREERKALMSKFKISIDDLD